MTNDPADLSWTEEDWDALLANAERFEASAWDLDEDDDALLNAGTDRNDGRGDDVRGWR